MPPFALKDAFNRYFHDGCSTFTKHEVLAYGAGDRQRINQFLAEWEAKGQLQVIKSLDQASDGDVMVKLLKVIA